MRKIQEREDAIKLRITGMPIRKIASLLKVSSSSVILWVKHLPEHEEFKIKNKLLRDEAQRIHPKKLPRIKKETVRNGEYLFIVATDNYPGKRYRGRYAYQHHFVYWLHFKKIPQMDEIIHHKNHNKHDNRIENLELMTKRDHCKHHAKPIAYMELECFKCKKKFLREKRQVIFRMKTQTKFFCSRGCLSNVTSK